MIQLICTVHYNYAHTVIITICYIPHQVFAGSTTTKPMITNSEIPVSYAMELQGLLAVWRQVCPDNLTISVLILTVSALTVFLVLYLYWS